MELNKDNMIMLFLASVLGTSGGTGLNTIFERDEGREEKAQWKAIGERMTEEKVKLYILENVTCP